MPPKGDEMRFFQDRAAGFSSLWILEMLSLLVTEVLRPIQGFFTGVEFDFSSVPLSTLSEVAVVSAVASERKGEETADGFFHVLFGVYGLFTVSFPSDDLFKKGEFNFDGDFAPPEVPELFWKGVVGADAEPGFFHVRTDVCGVCGAESPFKKGDLIR